MKTITNKQVNIIERLELRRVDRVVYRCKSSRDEKVYNVVLKNGKAERCTCDGHTEWHRTCYHMVGCESAEREKRETERAWMEYHEMAC